MIYEVVFAWCLGACDFPSFFHEKQLVGNSFFSGWQRRRHAGGVWRKWRGHGVYLRHSWQVWDGFVMTWTHQKMMVRKRFFFPPRICWCNISIVRDCTADVGDAIQSCPKPALVTSRSLKLCSAMKMAPQESAAGRHQRWRWNQRPGGDDLDWEYLVLPTHIYSIDEEEWNEIECDMI